VQLGLAFWGLQSTQYNYLFKITHTGLYLNQLRTFLGGINHSRGLEIHSNIKTDSTLLKLGNENLVCRMCVRQRQHMWVRRAFKVF